MTEYRTILYVIGIALVEIRASEKIAKSRALADIFHNVPAGISTEKPEAEIVQEVMSRAARLGVERTISNYCKLAEKSIFLQLV